MNKSTGRVISLFIVIALLTLCFNSAEVSASEDVGSNNQVSSNPVKLNISCDTLPGETFHIIADNDRYTFFVLRRIIGEAQV